MEFGLTNHAKERMREYNVEEKMVNMCLDAPDEIVDSYLGRKVYQKKLNGYVLRVIVEESKEIKRVITVYKARKKRYGI